MLGRATDYIFYPGDIIRSNYTAVLYQGWPDITVTQDPVNYANRLDKGLSFDGATGKIDLGRTSATDQAEITLNWDSGMTGTIDWTLRWKGNHENELRTYYSNGQIKIGSLPTGMAFNPNDNIFFDSTSGYTYVGFRRATNTWTHLPDFPATPKGRFGAVAFSIGGKGYLGTGSSDDGHKNDFWKYVPAGQGTWTRMRDFPGSAREYAVAFAIGGKGYIGTGMGTNDFYEYDAVADTWTLIPFPYPGAGRSNAVAFAIKSQDGKVRGYVGTGGPGVGDFYEFDNTKLPGNPWTRKADFANGTTVKRSAIGFSIGGSTRKGYVLSGMDNTLRNPPADFWEYDPDKNTWTRKPDFPGGGESFGTGFGTDDKGYAFEPGGKFYEYDPKNETWSLKASPVGAPKRESAIGFSIGNTGYYGTGYNYSYLADFWKYEP